MCLFKSQQVLLVPTWHSAAAAAATYFRVGQSSRVGQAQSPGPTPGGPHLSCGSNSNACVLPTSCLTPGLHNAPLAT